MLFYSTHPLIKIMINISVEQLWILDYLKFHFNWSVICHPSDAIIYICEKKNGNIVCSYYDRKFEFTSEIECVTTKLTSWLQGIYNEILFRNNIYVLHGASCVYNNQTLLFLGDKGVGKTTLLYKILAAGGLFLSDDNIYFSFDNNCVYHSDFGMRMKNALQVDYRYFSLFPNVLNGVRYIQPQRRVSTYKKPDKIYVLSKECNSESVNMRFSDFVKLVISNIKNSNCGLIEAKKLIQIFNLTEIKIVNAFEIDDICTFLGQL